MWRSRRWRLLLNIINHLPRNSAYAEALADDEQIAALILAHPPDTGPPSVRVSDWTAEREVLAEISDRLATLIAATIAAAGAKPPTPRPSARPRTAADRLRDRDRELRHLSLVARVLPDREGRERAAGQYAHLAGLSGTD